MGARSDSDSEKPKKKRKPYEPTPEDRAVIDYLNAIRGTKITCTAGTTREIRRAFSQDGATVDDCKLVLDFLWHTDHWSDDIKAKNFGSITPFRASLFQEKRELAKQWDANGRKALSPGDNGRPGAQPMMPATSVTRGEDLSDFDRFERGKVTQFDGRHQSSPTEPSTGARD